jgi:hypothetical protein
MKLARYIVEDDDNTVTPNFTNSIKTSDGYVPNLSIPKMLALTIMKKPLLKLIKIAPISLGNQSQAQIIFD